WHGIFLVIERVSGRRTAQSPSGTLMPGHLPSSSRAAAVGGHVYTLGVVMIGWVFFRAETLANAVGFLKAMAGLSPAASTPFTVQWYLTPELWLALVTGAIGTTPWIPALAARV